jgi:hypothetical protein
MKKYLHLFGALLLTVALVACDGILPAQDVKGILPSTQDAEEGYEPAVGGMSSAKTTLKAAEAGYCYWDGWMETAAGEWVTCDYVAPPTPKVELFVPTSPVIEGAKITLTLTLSDFDDKYWVDGTILIAGSYQGKYWLNLADKPPDETIRFSFDTESITNGKWTVDYEVPIVHPDDWVAVHYARVNWYDVNPDREIRFWIKSNSRRWTGKGDHTVTVTR